MASDNNWIDDTVNDFIHSPIWRAPIHTFVEANCVTFDYDDEDEDEDSSERDLMEKSSEEQKRIHQQYQRLANSLIDSLGKDLGLDQNELNRACQAPTPFEDSALADESYEQLYSVRDFQLFQNMMKRKNLILQLQALVSLQLQWGLLTQGDTSDDLVLALLLQATSSSSRRGSVNLPSEAIQVPTARQQWQKIESKPKYDDDDDDDDVVITPQREPQPSSSRKTKPKVEAKKPAKEEYRLPDLRHKGGSDLDAEWHRDLRRQDSKDNDDDDGSTATPAPQSIETIPEKVLRQKLRDLTERTSSAVDDETAAAMQARKKFLQDQREKIVNEKRAERARELEQQQASHARPQSAAHTARKAMATTDESKREQQQPEIPNDELNKRRAMMAKLKREVVDKR